MKYLIAVLALSILAIPSLAERNRRSANDVYVGGHTKKDGTYVEPYYRSAPNANKWDNYGYEPSQPKYNAPRSNPSPSWNTPNPGRMYDSNPYNDSEN